MILPHSDLDRVNLNVYDAFSPRDCLDGRPVRLFGNRNIGVGRMTNMMTGGVLPSDSSALVTNWYARTNLPEDLPAYAEWANAVTVRLVVGLKVMSERPLAELVQPRRESGFGGAVEEDDDAKRLRYEAYVSPETHALAQRLYLIYMSSSRHGRRDFAELGHDEVSAWCAVAEFVAAQPRPVPISVRQMFYVEVVPESRTTARLLEMMLSLSHIHEPAVWIHLSGLLSRMVY